MGGLTSAVNWWEASQLRVLVLASVAVQFLLFIFSSYRSSAVPRCVRFMTWLAYLAGDAVAIYALATLFNRHKDDQGGGSSTLEVMWAPVLLIHLGGHDGITAYNIEDNELWSRHLVTAVSQVTVAIYVFCKSWPPGGDKRLLQAAILLFIPGVVKCFMKPWALKSASIYSLVSSAVVEQDEGDMYPLEQYVKRAKEFVDGDQDRPPRHRDKGNNGVDDVATTACAEDEDHPPSQGLLCAQLLEPLRNYLRSFKRERITEQVKRIEEYRKVFQELDPTLGKVVVEDEQTWTCVEEDEDHSASQGGHFCAQLLHLLRQGFKARQVIRRRLRVLGEASYKLFVDLSSPYPCRLSILEYCWGISEGRVYSYVERGLATAFLLLYTKLKTVGFVNQVEMAREWKDSDGVTFRCRVLIHVARLVLPLVSIGLFHRSHSHSKAHNNDDIDAKITYVIFCCTAVLEICSVLPIWLEDFDLFESDFSTRESVGRWPGMVAQYSLIGYFASNKKHSKWMCIAGIFRCTDFVHQRMLCTMKPCCSSAIISGLVLGYLKDGWKKAIHDAPSYRRFNDHNTLWPMLLGYHVSLSSSMRKRPFDESVLLWHIATDFCFSLSLAASEHTFDWDCAACKAVQSRDMSNYMVYLLFVNPEMLLPGTRRNLFTDAYDGLNHILKDMDMDMDIPMRRTPPNVKKDEWVMLQRVINTMQKRNTSKEASEPCLGEEPNKVSPPEEEKSNKKGGRSKEKLIDDAWALAQRLLDNKGDEKKMWEEIQRVWVEMLCFSASRCRGYLHAKALGEGGELLSYVWLLLFYMGMETFNDKLHREEPRTQEVEAGNNATAPPSTPNVSTTGTTASSTYDICIIDDFLATDAGAAPSTSEICMAEDDMV